MYLWTFENTETNTALTVESLTFDKAKRAARVSDFLRGAYNRKPIAILSDDRARNYYKYRIEYDDYIMYFPTKKAVKDYIRKHGIGTGER